MMSRLRAFLYGFVFAVQALGLGLCRMGSAQWGVDSRGSGRWCGDAGVEDNGSLGIRGVGGDEAIVPTLYRTPHRRENHNRDRVILPGTTSFHGPRYDLAESGGGRRPCHLPRQGLRLPRGSHSSSAPSRPFDRYKRPAEHVLYARPYTREQARREAIYT